MNTRRPSEPSYRLEKDRSLSLAVAKRIMEGGDVVRIGKTQEVWGDGVGT